ncbi:TonB-dependent receptor [Phenylobacterium sp.]|jgi:iron complex outermembrane receptor protein|uniref:TonB-dependent receptor plug domain-containing protein n=1 Tax=Phenylobacterium sp. TaxID=1871053 RepID=UPI002E32E3E9|nr:TonB-dependent receptor [Phenylobacterium sp.]HEX3366233.1 TonB-dependent receptor [Phenylobacterium sp.]
MKNLHTGASVLVLSALIAPAAFAAAPAPDTAAGVSEVIVTGTRVTGVKAEDSAAPIQVVGALALKRVGQPDLIQALSQNLPSFNAEGYAADTAALTLSAALRGLNPNDTLVLVNGKRRHPTANLHVDPSSFQGAATADLSFIPVGSIDHVEVLTDGAAAQYGSDAIAGVVNIILKNGNHGGAASITGGQYYEGDGDTGAWSLNKGFEIGDKGFFNATVEQRYHGFSRQGGADRRLYTVAGAFLPGTSAIDKGAAGAPGAPDVNNIYGDTQSNTYDGFYNAGYDLGGGLEVYSTGSYGHRKASAFENYRVPSKVTRTVGATTIVPFPNGFSPREQIVEDDYAGTLGIRGVVAGWNWDLSTTYGRDKDDVSTINSANASLFADTGQTPRNFFDGTFAASEWTTTLDIDRSFDVGMAAPMNVALGAENRESKFTIGQGDPLSTYKEGGQSFPGFQKTDAATHTRTNYAGYGDLALVPISGLKVDLAGRYEHYNDFGSTTVGKLTARYDFTPAFALRGTISDGFRAPTLAEEFYSATNVAPTFAVVQLPANSPAAHLAGFPNLKPEKSTNYSVGFIGHPVEGLQITLDAYQIDIRNRIVATGTLLGLNNGAVVSQGVLNAIAAHGNVLDPGVTYVGISVFTNGANTKTQGLEFTGNYASDFGDMGHVDWSVGVNYNKTTIEKQSPLPAAVTSVAIGQTVLLGANAVDTLTTAVPREKVILGAYWTLGKWSANLRDTVFGETSERYSLDGTGNNGIKTRIPVTSITDLEIDYAIRDDLKLAMGANNLFDHHPPGMPNVSNGAGGVRPADGNNVYGEPLQYSPFGINGGYYYGRLTFTF